MSTKTSKTSEAKARAAREGLKLAASIRSAVAQAAPGAKAVLVTSAEPGAGKSTICKLASEAPTTVPIVVATVEDLAETTPEEFLKEDQLVLIDGPAAASGMGLAGLPKGWANAIEASLVIASRRQSTLSSLRELSETLDALGAPCAGVIVNEHTCPSPGDMFRRLKARFGRGRKKG